MFVRTFARPLLASIFISEGVDTLRNPGPRVEAAEPVVDLIKEAAQPVAQRAAGSTADAVSRATHSVESAAETAAGKVDDAAAKAVMTADAVGDPASAATDKAAAASDAITEVSSNLRANVHGVAAGQPLPFQTETYVKVNAGVQLAAGLLLATGKAPRLASAALAATLVPTTFAAHRFWELEEGEERSNQQVHFMKNVGLLGGLILASADTAGKPGLAWKAQHLGHDSAVAAKAARANAALAAQAAASNTRAARRLAKANAKVAGKAGKLGVEKAGAFSSKHAKHAATVARREAQLAAVIAAKEAKIARKLARKGWETTQARADVLRPQAQAKAAELIPQAQAKAAELIPQAQAKAAELGKQAQLLGARVSERLPSAA